MKGASLLLLLIVFLVRPAAAADEKKRVADTPDYLYQLLVITGPPEVRESIASGEPKLWERATEALRDGSAKLIVGASALVAEHGYAGIDNAGFRMLDIRPRPVENGKRIEVAPFWEYKEQSGRYRAVVDPGVAAILFQQKLDTSQGPLELVGIVRIVETALRPGRR